MFLGMLMVAFHVQSQIVHHEVEIMDTIWFEGEQIVRYNDYSWNYLGGNVNDSSQIKVQLIEYTGLDSSDVFGYNWNTGKTYSRDFDLKKYSDTIELRLLSKYDANVFLPQIGSVTSPFGPRWGRMHQGVDIKLKTGDKVHSCFGGKVRYARYNQGGYGNLVIVRHYNGLESYYAHLSKVAVNTGDIVNAGDLLGYGGSTGHSTGPHLHFEIRYLDNALDPQAVFDFKNQRLKAVSYYILRGRLLPIDLNVDSAGNQSKAKPVNKKGPGKTKRRPITGNFGNGK